MMKSSIGMRLLVVSITVLSSIRSTAAIAANTDCSPVTCVVSTSLYQFPTNTKSALSYFCTQIVPQYFNCLASCRNPQADPLFRSVNNYINSVCSQNNTGCSSMTSLYASFANCYSGNLAAITNSIASSYNNRNHAAFDASCRNLVWGKNCQSQRASRCSYLSQISTNDIQSSFATTAAFYICGAETALFTFNETGSCGQNIAPTLNSRCSVMCNISRATSIPQVCQILQSQADCIMNATSGCSVIQSQYIVPRLASYWAANQYLDCNIQIKNFKVGPRVTECNFTSVLMDCFNVSTNGSLEAIKMLLTGQFETSQICRLLNTPRIDPSMLIHQCAEAMRSCAIPLGLAYNWPASNAPNTVYSTTRYFPELGPFALDAWGLQSLITHLTQSNCEDSGSVLDQCETNN